MAGNNQAGKVQTVLGPIDPGHLGVTMTHEHVLSDFAQAYFPVPNEAGAKEFYYQPLTMENVGYVRYYGARNLEDARLGDLATAISEIMLYKQNGGESMVDATSVGILRDPRGLAQISRTTGVNIIMGASYYIDSCHPADMDQTSEDELVERIVSDIQEGADGTSIKAGIIGEVGCSWPLTKNERKVLRASGRAQRRTGAPILIHPGRDQGAPLEILEVLGEVDADLGRVIIGHMDWTKYTRDSLKQVSASGCYLEWDLFGRQGGSGGVNYRLSPPMELPSFRQRIEEMAWISGEGYADKVLLSNDVAFKRELVKYGGYGYSYILNLIAPMMRMLGFTEQGLHEIMVNNSGRILTFAEAAAS